jgi:hypothetical protein
VVGEHRHQFLKSSTVKAGFSRASRDGRQEYGDTPDHNDLIALTQGLWQGAWKSRCINPECESQRKNILAVIDHDDVDGVHFWDKWGEGEQVQIVYEICPRCSTILATNQCT